MKTIINTFTNYSNELADYCAKHTTRKEIKKKKNHTNKQINKVTKFKRIEIYSSSTVHIHFHLIDFATQVDV